MQTRPPVGFIVEGHGEHNCYPSLFCKINNSSGFKVPVINAGGCGSIVKRLPQQLNDLLTVDSPEHVIVTVDLKDVLSQNLAQSEEQLIQILETEIAKWRAEASTDTRLHPLPKKIVCLAQVLKFESWILADTQGLKTASIIKTTAEDLTDAEAIAEPVAWLKKNMVSVNDIKNPKFAKTVIAALDPREMRHHSKSFGKFYTHCCELYEAWLKSSGMEEAA